MSPYVVPGLEKKFSDLTIGHYRKEGKEKPAPKVYTEMRIMRSRKTEVPLRDPSPFIRPAAIYSNRSAMGIATGE